MWSTGINRNIVECKVIFQKVFKRFRIVLIETLWNVKVRCMLLAKLSRRINRNIVECKVGNVLEWIYNNMY